MAYFDINVPPSKALRVMAVISVAQTVILAHQLFKVANVTATNEARARFLFDFATRNTAQLEEFDLIALRELGLLKPS